MSCQSPISILMIILLLALLIFSSGPKTRSEKFTSILNPETGEFELTEQLRYNKKKDRLLDTKIQDYLYCKELCRTSYQCNAFDYALNRCILYKNATKAPSTSWLYRGF